MRTSGALVAEQLLTPLAPVEDFAAGTCFHCAEALPMRPARRPLDGGERLFCCEGCAAAADWIRDARLDDYYRLRSAPASRVVAEADDLALWDREDVLAAHARPVA